jgi:hypothetical protein
MDQDLAGFSLFNAKHIDGLLLDYVLWCDVNNSRTTADGSVGDPYASIQTALDKFATDGITDGTARTVIAMPGVYDENLTIPGKGSISILFMHGASIGTVSTPRSISRTCDSADQVPGIDPSLRLAGIGFTNLYSPGWAVMGGIVLADATAGVQQTLHVSDGTVASFGSATTGIDGTGQTQSIALSVVDSTIAGVNASTADLKCCSKTTFSAALTLYRLSCGLYSNFYDDIAVTLGAGAAGTQLEGLRNCVLVGDWTGPASSFKVDSPTYYSFKQNGGSLLGGATLVQLDEPFAHAASHIENAADELTVQDLGSGAATNAQRLVADGAGGWNVSSTIDCGTW